MTLWVDAQPMGIPASSSLGPRKCSQSSSVPKRPFDQGVSCQLWTQGRPQTRQTRGPHWHLLASVRVTLGLVLFQPWHGHPHLGAWFWKETGLLDAHLGARPQGRERQGQTSRGPRSLWVRGLEGVCSPLACG